MLFVESPFCPAICSSSVAVHGAPGASQAGPSPSTRFSAPTPWGLKHEHFIVNLGAGQGQLSLFFRMISLVSLRITLPRFAWSSVGIWAPWLCCTSRLARGPADTFGLLGHPMQFCFSLYSVILLCPSVRFLSVSWKALYTVYSIYFLVPSSVSGDLEERCGSCRSSTPRNHRLPAKSLTELRAQLLANNHMEWAWEVSATGGRHPKDIAHPG